MMRAAETETFEQNVHHVFLQLLPLFRTQDFQEGVAAFMEKRARRSTVGRYGARLLGWVSTSTNREGWP